MSGAKWIGELAAEVVESVRHQVVEKPWFGEIVTPSHGGHGQTSAERLGWDVPVKPEHRPNIDMEHFYGRCESTPSSKRDHGLGQEPDLEPARERELNNQSQDLDR